MAKTFLLVEHNHITDAISFERFINTNVDNTAAFNMLLENVDIKTHEVTAVYFTINTVNALDSSNWVSL